MKKKYELTPEHKEQLKPWADKWIANAMSTKPMNEADKAAMKVAVKGLYESAGLIAPPEHRIVFVPSPFVARFAGGFAAAIWYNRKSGRAATDAATSDATYAATSDATYAATSDKTKWFQFDIKAMVSLSLSLKIGKFGLQCAGDAYRMWQGGNQWSAWDSFLSFFRHVAKLDIDYSKYEHWETAAIHGGPRIMHPEFCIVSDRPTVLKVNERNQPHCFDGPYCAWSDGSALYAINGVRVPAWICETKKDDFTKEMILSETNVDNRRCIIQKMGIDKAIEVLGAEAVDSYISDVGGKYELLSIDYDGRGNRRPYLKMISKSIDASHIEGVAPGVDSVKKALMYRNKLKTFIEPEMLS